MVIYLKKERYSKSVNYYLKLYYFKYVLKESANSSYEDSNSANSSYKILGRIR